MSKAFGFVAYGGPETQEFLDRPTPEPAPGQLLIAVRAAGVNPADWKFRKGLFGTSKPLPIVLGFEVSGVVQALGAGVEGYAVGDEVFGNALTGGYAEHTLLQAAKVARKPAGVSFAQAAALPVAGTAAYDAVEQLGLQQGQKLLILGVSGGVGTAAAQIARQRGITVLGTASEAKRAAVESLGASHVRYGEGVAERVRAAAPDGVDGILDLVGGDSLRAVAGTVHDPGRIVSTVDPATVAELGGAYIRRAANTAAVLAELAGLVASGALDPNVTARYPLEHAAEALLAVESGHASGKLVIEVD